MEELRKSNSVSPHPWVRVTWIRHILWFATDRCTTEHRAWQFLITLYLTIVHSNSIFWTRRIWQGWENVLFYNHCIRQISDIWVSNLSFMLPRDPNLLEVCRGNLTEIRNAVCPNRCWEQAREYLHFTADLIALHNTDRPAGAVGAGRARPRLV